MKQETTGRKKKWILPVVIAAAVLVIVGIVLAVVLIPGGQEGGEVTSKLYWNVDRQQYLDPESGFTTRPAGEDGLYTIRFSVDGEQVDLQCADKRLVNIIDMMDLMGLQFDADGLIVDAVAPETVAKEIAKEYFVKSFDGTNLSVNSSMAMNGMGYDYTLGENAHIYDVTPEAEVVGAPGEVDVMDKISIYGNEEGEITHVYRLTVAVGAEVYHRLYRRYDKVNKVTSRVPENGVYTIEFAHKGQLVDLQCKDKEVVSNIDKAYDAGAQMGLIFDDEGYIIKTISAPEAIKGQLLLKKVSVAAVDGDLVTFESRFYSNSDIGETAEVILPEDCEMYLIEADCEAHFIGEKTDYLKVGDRCYVYSDFEGNVKMIFVERRMVESELYYNITRQYDAEKKETKRVPVGGYYVFEFALNGKQIKLKTADKAIADRIDSIESCTMGLKLNGDIIEAVYGNGCVVGVGSMSNRFILDVMGSIVTTCSRDDWETASNYMLAADCQIYDVTNNCNVPVGSVTEVQKYDWLQCMLYNENNEITHLYIKQRYYEDAKLVWHLNQQYDSTTKETARERNEQGYYVFEMLSDGKKITMKTKDKSVATWIDKNKYPVAVRLSGQNIIGVYSAGTCVPGGTTWRSPIFHSLKEDRTIVYTTADNPEPAEGRYKLAEGCAVYNNSVVYTKSRGEKTTLQRGDVMYGIYSRRDYAFHKMMVYNGRELDAPLYWHVKRSYNFTLKETTRVPDADGWYVYQLAVDGQVKTFKTKDKEVANKIDARSAAFTLILNGDVIVDMLTYPYTKAVQGTAAAGYTITAINGNTVTAKNMTPSSETYGEVQKVTLKKGCKIYNVSPNTEKFGAVDTLAVGDKIYCYTDDNGKAAYVYITQEDLSEFASPPPAETVCPGCGETVTEWTLVTTASGDNGWTAEMSGHYYLGLDITSENKRVFSFPAGADVCLHLNGHNITSTCTTSGAVTLRVYGTLRLMGEGTVSSGENTSATGAVVPLTGGVVEVYGGNYVANTGKAAVRPNGGKATLYGGTFNTNPGSLVAAGYIATQNPDNTWTVAKPVAPDLPTTCPGCGEAVNEWLPVTAAPGDNGWTTDMNGHYYLVNDISSKNKRVFSFPAGTDVCLHLNGNDITSTCTTSGAITLRVYGTLRLMGEGTVSSGENTAAMGPVVAYTGGSVEIYGGTYITNTTEPVLRNSGGTITVKGGTFSTNPSTFVADGYHAEQNADGTYTVVEGEGEPGTDPEQPGLPTTCPGCGETVTEWTAVTAAPGDNGWTADMNGHYYLENDISGRNKRVFSFPAGTDVCLYLNGHNITSTCATSGAITLRVYGTLRLMGEGTVSSGENTAAMAPVVAYTGASVEIYGGTYVANTTEDVLHSTGGTFVVKGGTFSTDPTTYVADGYEVVENEGMYTVQPNGGTQPTPPANPVENCPACNADKEWTELDQAAYDALSVDGDSTKTLSSGHYYLTSNITSNSKRMLSVAAGQTVCLDLNGFDISNTSTNTGSGTIICAGTLNVVGNGTVTCTTPDKEGARAGAVVAYGGTVNLYGGTYTATNGYAVLNTTDGGTLNVREGVTVTKGYLLQRTGANVLNITGGTFGATFRIKGDATKVTVTGGTFTAANPSAYVPTTGYAVTENNGTYTVERVFDGNTVDNAKLVFAQGTTNAKCPICDQVVTWTEVTNTMDELTTGHYYLSKNMERSTAKYMMTVAADNTVTLHLNGFNFTNSYAEASDGCRAIECAGTLNILGNGTVSAAKASKTGTGVVTAGGGTVNLYGGTYQAQAAGNAALGVNTSGQVSVYAGATVKTVMTTNVGTFNIYGGTFEGYFRRSNASEASVLNISGGTFTNATMFHATAGAPATTVITGGSFKVDPTAYVDTTAYDVTEAEGVYTVAAKNS